MKMGSGSSRLKGLTVSARRIGPGVLMAFTLAAAARFMAEHYGAPAMVTALLLGMAFYFLSEEGPCQAGIQFTSDALLKVGVALLGVQVNFAEIAALGVKPLIVVPSLVVATIVVGVGIAVLFRRSAFFGLLSGGAVAICGASAALALSAVLPKDRIQHRDTLFTVLAVTTLSSVAMIFYPILFASLGFNDTQMGVLIGATIHDVAQVVGAGYAVSEETGDVATFVKLLRIVLLPALVLAFALIARRSGGGEGRLSVPLFVWGFGVLLVLNSLGVIPEDVREAVQVTARWLLIAAIAAMGMKTSLKAMSDLGAPHIMILVSQTLFLCIAAMVLVSLF